MEKPKEFYPFDLERAKAGDEIVTKEGHTVEFLAIDNLMANYPVFCALRDNGTVQKVHFSLEGHYKKGQESLRLFMKNPPKEKAESAGVSATEFEASLGSALIARERARQILGEGYNHKKDDAYIDSQLTFAAQAYLTGDATAWPWEKEYFKLSVDRIRNLTKAGALIAAEIDRLDRLNSDFGTQKSIKTANTTKAGEVLRQHFINVCEAFDRVKNTLHKASDESVVETLRAAEIEAVKEAQRGGSADHIPDASNMTPAREFKAVEPLTAGELNTAISEIIYQITDLEGADFGGDNADIRALLVEHLEHLLAAQRTRAGV